MVRGGSGQQRSRSASRLAAAGREPQRSDRPDNRLPGRERDRPARATRSGRGQVGLGHPDMLRPSPAVEQLAGLGRLRGRAAPPAGRPSARASPGRVRARPIRRPGRTPAAGTIAASSARIAATRSRSASRHRAVAGGTRAAVTPSGRPFRRAAESQPSRSAMRMIAAARRAGSWWCGVIGVDEVVEDEPRAAARRSAASAAGSRRRRRPAPWRPPAPQDGCWRGRRRRCRSTCAARAPRRGRRDRTRSVSPGWVATLQT